MNGLPVFGALKAPNVIARANGPGTVRTLSRSAEGAAHMIQIRRTYSRRDHDISRFQGFVDLASAHPARWAGLLYFSAFGAVHRLTEIRMTRLDMLLQ